MEGNETLQMKKGAKTKQIVVRFDHHSYTKINNYAEMEHRGLGEFVRHTALVYIERLEREKELLNEKGGSRP